jgi:hypothetical protein
MYKFNTDDLIVQKIYINFFSQRLHSLVSLLILLVKFQLYSQCFFLIKVLRFYSPIRF